MNFFKLRIRFFQFPNKKKLPKNLFSLYLFKDLDLSLL